jgi:(p)ppGpp synthase/HD superfamily hydrolase
MSSFATQIKGNIATIELTMEIADIAVLPRVLTRIEQLPNVIEAYRPKAG